MNIECSMQLGNIDLVTSGGFTRAGNGIVWNQNRFIDDYRSRISADLLGVDV
jgi:hypothetical protein